jgi:putative membrane protein
MMWYGPHVGAIGWFGALLGFLLFVLLVVGIVWAVMHLVGRGPAAPGDPSAEILRQRFARGEITQTEYEEAKRILGIR